MQGKSSQQTEVKIIQPTEDAPGEYRVKVGGRWVDYSNPDLFKSEQRTLEPVRYQSGVIWTPTDR